MGLAAAGLAWMTGLNLTSGCAAHVMPPPIVLGLVLGLVMAPAMSPATSGVAAEDAGVASATVNTMQQIGGSIGTAQRFAPPSNSAGRSIRAGAGQPRQPFEGRAGHRARSLRVCQPRIISCGRRR